MHKKPFDPLIEGQGFKTRRGWHLAMLEQKTHRMAALRVDSSAHAMNTFMCAYTLRCRTLSHTQVCTLERYSCMHLSVVLLCAI